jgi:hypothetical protein
MRHLEALKAMLNGLIEFLKAVIELFEKVVLWARYLR